MVLVCVAYGKMIKWIGLIMTTTVATSLCRAMNCTDGDVRLSAMDSINETGVGLLEICDSNMWGTVCDLHWDSIDSRVACRQLGYHDGYEISVLDFNLFELKTPKYGTAFQCKGMDTKLTSCTHVRTNFETTSCVGSSDVWLFCYENCILGEIRLVGTQFTSRGKADVCYENAWWPWCDDDTGLPEYAVMCRQLGFFSGYHSIGVEREVNTIQFVRVITEEFISMTLNFRIECTGDESNIVACAKQGTFQYSCNGIEDQLQLVCIDAAEAHNCSHGDLRLVGGRTSSEGRLEICFNHVWGTVCDENWDSTDATVACKQLGFRSAASSVSHDAGQGTGPIFMTNVRCRGTFSTNLSGCSFDDNHIKVSRNCDHNNDVHLACVSNDHTVTVLIVVVVTVVLIAILAIFCASISLVIAITTVKRRKKDNNKQSSSTSGAAVCAFPGPANILFDDNEHTYEYIDNFNISSPSTVESQSYDHLVGTCIETENETVSKSASQESQENHQYAILELKIVETNKAIAE